MSSTALNGCSPLMRRPMQVRWLSLVALVGIAYPFVVYTGLAYLPPQAICLLAVALVGGRAAVARRNASLGGWMGPLVVALVVLLVLLVASPSRAVKAYPVLM